METERGTGLEPATSDLEGRRSTIELLPRTKLVAVVGTTAARPRDVERGTGLEPAAFDLAERCTTIVLPPQERLAAGVSPPAQVPLVVEAGIEPATSRLSSECSDP